MRALKLRPLIINLYYLLLFDIHLLHIMSPLYPGQLPPFRFETETKPKSKRIRLKQIRPNRIRSKQVRLNVAERRAAMRVSMSTLRRRKLQQFDYEAYRADFAKRCVFTKVIR